MIDGAYQGLFALRRGRVGKGTRLLVYGASGSCGTACVQLGSHLGAHVTAVCGTKNVELVRSLGADVVVDYQREDFRKRGEKYDVDRRCGREDRWVALPRLARPRRDVRAHRRVWNVLGVLLTRWGGRRVVASWPRYEKEDLLFLKRLLETGEYRAVIDRTYPLEDVAEAHRYVDTWQKTGNVVLTVDGGPAVRAVVYDRYGPPQVPRLEESSGPCRRRTSCSSGSAPRRSTGPTAADGARAVLRPLLHRLLRPKSSGSRHGASPASSRRSARPSPSSRSVTRSSACRLGAHAEYVCVRESGALAHKPGGMTLRGRRGGLRRRVHRPVLPAEGGSADRAKLLVYGASGAVGTAAVQLARHFGARRHSRVQHEERRARALARSRPRDRLHAGGLHEERRDVRRRSSTRSASARSGGARAR